VLTHHRAETKCIADDDEVEVHAFFKVSMAAPMERLIDIIGGRDQLGLEQLQLLHRFDAMLSLHSCESTKCLQNGMTHVMFRHAADIPATTPHKCQEA
jgi:hypothetical protein